jgi:hypothetical protein
MFTTSKSQAIWQSTKGVCGPGSLAFHSRESKGLGIGEPLTDCLQKTLNVTDQTILLMEIESSFAFGIGRLKEQSVNLPDTGRTRAYCKYSSPKCSCILDW